MSKAPSSLFYLLSFNRPLIQRVYTQAKSLDELMKRMREAVEAYLETEGKEAVKGLKTEFVGVQLLEVEA